LELPVPTNSLFFFGFYCISLGYLMFRSTFVPRNVGVLMALAGFWVLLVNSLAILLPPALAHVLSPIGFTLDGIGCS
jgi:hypothetical protein